MFYSNYTGFSVFVKQFVEQGAFQFRGKLVLTFSGSSHPEPVERVTAHSRGTFAL